MKKDIGSLMHERGIEALWVRGPSDHNPNMVYFTGLKNMTSPDLFIKDDASPVLVCDAMEREEAEKTGLRIINKAKYSLNSFLKQSNGNYLKAVALQYQAILQDFGINRGKLAISGRVEFGSTFALMNELKQIMPMLEILGFIRDDPLTLARMTKDREELAHIQKMGRITTEVVGKVADFLSQQKIHNETLIQSNGQPLTVGEIKRLIRLWIVERGAEIPEEIIFAFGRDAGIPHSAGQPDDIIRTGIPIVFDIFPCEAGGGYFYDFTRTWCLGYAPDEVYKVYEEVYSVYKTIITELKCDIPFNKIQSRTCQLLAQKGHKTIAEEPELEEGYVHSIGHGLGLAVHEKPASGIGSDSHDVLKPGVVITIEPGLYYPSRNLGVRIEDTYFADESGDFKIMADYPYELIIPVKKS